MYTVTRRLSLTRDHSCVVPDGHPDAAYLFAIPGTILPDHEAARWRLADVERPQDTQHVAGPAETTVIAGRARKGR